MYLTPLIGGFVADHYLGSKRSVKFGAIVMASAISSSASAATPPSRYAIIDGQRYEVQVENFVDRPTSSGQEVRYVVDRRPSS